MPIAEALAMKVASEVLGFALRELALDERLRKAFGRDPAQRAYARALEHAVVELDDTSPQWTASLFDATFFEHEGAPILARFLTRTGHADPAELADVWARSIGLHEGARQPRVRGSSRWRSRFSSRSNER